MKPFSEPWGAFEGTPLWATALLGCGAGFYLFGYDQGIANALQQNEDFWQHFPTLRTNSSLLGAVFGLFVIGALLGCLFVTAVGNKFGRRPMLMIGAVGTLIGAALQAGSINLAMFIISRLINGFFVGILTSVVPPYIGELSKPKHRGLLMSSELVICSSGLMTAFWVTYGFAPNQGPIGWRMPLALQAIFVLITIVTLFFSPESPRWLIEVGRKAEGRELLRRMYGEDFAAASVQEIEEAVALEHATKVTGIRACFEANDQGFRYRTLLALGVNAMQQATGVNMATYYAGTIFIDAIGMEPAKATLALGGLGIVGLVACAGSAFFLIDRFGRVRTLMLGAFLQSVGMCCLAGGIANIDGNARAGVAAAFGLFLFIASFSGTWLPLGWIYGAEVTPLATRSQASSLGYGVQYLINFLIVEVTPIGISSIGYRFYIPFAVSNAVMIPILFFFYPEISGLSLEGIDALWTNGKTYMRRSPNEKIETAYLEKSEAKHIDDVKTAGSSAPESIA